MRALTITTLVLAAGSLWAAQIPRQSPDFAIQLANGKQIKVSDYRGKVLCLTFILTTCPHCQKTTQIWDTHLPAAGAQGFAVVEAALNENPNISGVRGAIQGAVSGWDRGSSSGAGLISNGREDKRPLVPFLVFIDRHGVIRAQYTGVEEGFFDNQQEQHMRDEAEKLLNEGAAKAKPAHKPAS